jgi:formate hydrogenlyase subunit 4
MTDVFGLDPGSPAALAVGVAIAIAQAAALAAIAPLVVGVLRKTKARFQGRRGPSIWQPYRDLRKWWARGTISSGASGPVQRLAPAVVLGAVLVATGFVPTLVTQSPLQAWGDLLTLTGLLVVARFAMALAALDAGSAFGGMGSSREVAISALVEPGLLLALVATAVAASSTDLGLIAGSQVIQGADLLTLSQVLAAAAFVLVAIAETGHLPVDNPDTHLELTMVHEGMLIESSGRGLALMTLAAHVRTTLIVAIFVAAFAPWGIARDLGPGALALGAAALTLKLLAGGVLLALADAGVPKLRILRLPEYLGIASALGLLAIATQIWLPR